MTRGIGGIGLSAMLALALASCATKPVAPKPTVEMLPAPPEPAWKGVANEADRTRVAAIPTLFLRARASVPKRLATKLAAEGPLVDPASAKALPQLPPGPYRCRLLRFGGSAHFATFPPDFCYVDVATDRLSLTKQTGSNLPEGYVFPDTDTRQIFLGTFRRAGDAPGKAYGADPANDLVGIVERVAPFRWRLVLARAGQGAMMDLYELVPVPPAVPGAEPAVAGP